MRDTFCWSDSVMLVSKCELCNNSSNSASSTAAVGTNDGERPVMVAGSGGGTYDIMGRRSRYCAKWPITRKRNSGRAGPSSRRCKSSIPCSVELRYRDGHRWQKKNLSPRPFAGKGKRKMAKEKKQTKNKKVTHPWSSARSAARTIAYSQSSIRLFSLSSAFGCLKICAKAS